MIGCDDRFAAQFGREPTGSVTRTMMLVGDYSLPVFTGPKESEPGRDYLEVLERKDLRKADLDWFLDQASHPEGVYLLPISAHSQGVAVVMTFGKAEPASIEVRGKCADGNYFAFLMRADVLKRNRRAVTTFRCP